jgi:hypothetical protein
MSIGSSHYTLSRDLEHFIVLLIRNETQRQGVEGERKGIGVCVCVRVWARGGEGNTQPKDVMNEAGPCTTLLVGTSWICFYSSRCCVSIVVIVVIYLPVLLPTT